MFTFSSCLHIRWCKLDQGLPFKLDLDIEIVSCAVRKAVVSHLPPRMGSVPWLAKSRPNKLSPSRIFCLHCALGASWRTQSLIQGSGALGPGLLKQNIWWYLCTCWNIKLHQKDITFQQLSPWTAGVVVCHKAESVDYRSQLFKLLPAKHTWLSSTEKVF